MDVRAVTSAIVEDCVPEEVDILRDFKPHAKYGGRRGPLAFGGDILIPLLTPVIWEVVEKFYDLVLKQLAEQSVKRLLDAVSARLALGLHERETLSAATSRVDDLLRAAGVDDERRASLAEKITSECLKATAHA